MSQQSLNLLIADDDKAIVASLKEQIAALATRHHDVATIFCASSATEVLEILSRNHMDAFLIDYHFEGGMNGDELIDHIEDPFHQGIVVLVSGRSELELKGPVIKKHKKLGSRFRFLKKPFSGIELESKYLEIQDFLSNRPYPFPLAYAQETFRAASTHQGRLTALKDMVEAFVKFASVVLSADCQRFGIIGKLHVGLGRNTGMTLGACLKWLTRLVDVLQDKSHEVAMPELLNLLLSETYENSSWIDVIYGFKTEIRDSELGHGAAKEEGWYRFVSQRYESQILALYHRCAFTARYPVVAIEQIDFAGDERLGYIYNGRYLMGVAALFSLISFSSADRLNRSMVYMQDLRNGFLRLHPFFAYRVCQACTAGRLWSLDWGAGTQFSYTAHCGHRSDIERAVTKTDEDFLENLTRCLFVSA